MLCWQGDLHFRTSHDTATSCQTLLVVPRCQTLVPRCTCLEEGLRHRTGKVSRGAITAGQGDRSTGDGDEGSRAIGRQAQQEGGGHAGTATNRYGRDQWVPAPDSSVRHGSMRLWCIERDGQAFSVSLCSIGPPASTSAAIEWDKNRIHLLLLEGKVKEFAAGIRHQCITVISDTYSHHRIRVLCFQRSCC